MTQKVNPSPVQATKIQMSRLRTRTSQPILQGHATNDVRLNVEVRLCLSASTAPNGPIVRHLDERRIDCVASEMRNYLEESAQSGRLLCQCQFVHHKTHTDIPGS
jgi:hypothetical protein